MIKAWLAGTIMFVPIVMLPVIQAEKFIFTIGRDVSHHKICAVIFRPNGSLFVTLPYFNKPEAIASVITIPPHREPITVNLEESGKVTSRHVKYTHYPNGEAHFSEDKQILTKIRRKVVPLTDAQGHIFSIYLKGLEHFELLKGNPEPTMKRATLGFGVHSATADCFKIVGEWRKAVPAAIINRQFYSPMRVPPMHRIVSPQGWPMDDYVLKVSCETLPTFSEEEAKFAFIGGFDSSSTIYGVSEDAQALCLLSPIPNYEELAKRIGSIDFCS